MQINGGIRFCEQGMKASIRAMHVQSEVLGMINENVAGFDKVGFQRREPVVSPPRRSLAGPSPKNFSLLSSKKVILVTAFIPDPLSA